MICRIVVTIACAAALLGSANRFAAAADAAVNIVALGDSLTAGLGLPSEQSFPAKLERALAAKGISARIANAGVSGDTAAGGLARLDWSVPDGTDAVIVELGANDALRGIDPAHTRTALESILRRLKERRIAVLLCGMRAPPNMGPEFTHAFDAMFPELARRYDTEFYPFFLDGVAGEATLNQRDGLHPSEDGIAVIVENILPKIEVLIVKVRQRRSS